jgi:hypothetical protein
MKKEFKVKPATINGYSGISMGRRSFVAEIEVRTENLKDARELQELFGNETLKWKIVIEDGKQ